MSVILIAAAQKCMTNVSYHWSCFNSCECSLVKKGTAHFCFFFLGLFLRHASSFEACLKILRHASKKKEQLDEHKNPQKMTSTSLPTSTKRLHNQRIQICIVTNLDPLRLLGFLVFAPIFVPSLVSLTLLSTPYELHRQDS